MLLSSDEMEIVGDTGSLEDAAVDGLRSCTGEGWRLRDADWMVEAIFMAPEAMLVEAVIRLLFLLISHH